MAMNNSVIIIIIVVAFAFFLIYTQNNQPKIINMPQKSGFSPLVANPNQTQVTPPNGQAAPLTDTQQSIQSPCTKCELYKNKLAKHYSEPQVANVTINQDNDPYSDPIKKQDLYGMTDPLTYPQLRLSREILNKYNEYREDNGSFPPFGQNTQPLFDNPILNGMLVKQVDENEPFIDNVPNSIPLFRVKAVKNSNRFFYYILEQRYSSKIELKIPLDNIKINNIRYANADFYGVPELYDGDIVDGILIYPNTKFVVKLYKSHHFP